MIKSANLPNPSSGVKHCFQNMHTENKTGQTENHEVREVYNTGQFVPNVKFGMNILTKQPINDECK